MVDAILHDHMGAEHVIRSAEDVNRIVAAVERHRDALAERMLGHDRAAAIAAEHASDRLEDGFVPTFAREVTRIATLLQEEAADEARRAKARAIQTRNEAGG